MEARLHCDTSAQGLQIDTTVLGGRQQSFEHLRVCPGVGVDVDTTLHLLEADGYLAIDDQCAADIDVSRHVPS